MIISICANRRVGGRTHAHPHIRIYVCVLIRLYATRRDVRTLRHTLTPLCNSYTRLRNFASVIALQKFSENKRVRDKNFDSLLFFFQFCLRNALNA